MGVICCGAIASTLTPCLLQGRHEVRFVDLHGLFGQNILKPDSKVINLKTFYDIRYAAARKQARPTPNKKKRFFANPFLPLGFYPEHGSWHIIGPRDLS